MKYKGLIFDLDNTLYSVKYPYAKAHAKALEFLTEKTPLEMEQLEESYLQAQKKVKARIPDTASSHSRALYFKEILENANIYNLDILQEVNNLYWKELCNQIRPNDGVVSFFDSISAAQAKLCILSDFTIEHQLEKLQSLGLIKYFDFIFTSEEVEKDKPHPSMYQRAIETLKLEPGQCLMIGDDLEKDVVAPIKFGMNALWYNPEMKEGPSEIISIASFNEIQDYLV